MRKLILFLVAGGIAFSQPAAVMFEGEGTPLKVGAGNVTCTAPTVVNNLLVATNTLGTGCADAGLSAVTAPLKVTAGVPGAATASDLIALWSGTCNSTSLLGGDGACKVVSSAFSGIASGTNTSAAMVVGAGATLAPTSTGTITANILTLGTIASLIKPSADSTSAVRFTQAGGSVDVLLLDTTNRFAKTIRLVGLDNSGFGLLDGATNPSLLLGSGGLLGWSSTSAYNGTRATSISQPSAGVISADTGTLGNSLGFWQGKHKSSDGTSGVSGSTCSAWKDGLCTAN